MTKKNNKMELMNEPITDAQCVETYCALSQQLYTQYHDRRTLDWRIHLALWTLLALTAYLCVTNDRHLGHLACGVFLLVPIHFVWIIKMARGQIFEQKLSIIYRLKAEHILSCRYPDGEKTLPIPEWEEKSDMPRILSKGFASYWWWLSVEVATTLLLCMGVWLLVR